MTYLDLQDRTGRINCKNFLKGKKTLLYYRWKLGCFQVVFLALIFCLTWLFFIFIVHKTTEPEQGASNVLVVWLEEYWLSE